MTCGVGLTRGGCVDGGSLVVSRPWKSSWHPATPLPLGELITVVQRDLPIRSSSSTTPVSAWCGRGCWSPATRRSRPTTRRSTTARSPEPATSPSEPLRPGFVGLSRVAGHRRPALAGSADCRLPGRRGDTAPRRLYEAALPAATPGANNPTEPPPMEAPTMPTSGRAPRGARAVPCPPSAARPGRHGDPPADRARNGPVVVVGRSDGETRAYAPRTASCCRIRRGAMPRRSGLKTR
jgi:hypothetical protein